jgi:hypothetical protein
MGETMQVNVPIQAPQEMPPATPPEGGSLIAGKFKTEDDLQKAILELIKKQQGDGGLEAYYKTLERQMGKPAEPQPATPGEPQPPEGDPPATPPENEVRDVLKESGLDFDELSQEFVTNKGTLTEASYEKLGKAGFPRPLVDAYIQGQMALAEKRNEQVFAAVGGETEYDAMIQWASVNLSEAERKAYNTALDKTDIGQTMLAVEGLYAKYKKATGSTSDLIEPTGIRTTGGGYISMSQMTLDMKDPRYKVDPAFRQMVADKIRKSNFM